MTTTYKATAIGRGYRERQSEQPIQPGYYYYFRYLERVYILLDRSSGLSVGHKQVRSINNTDSNKNSIGKTSWKRWQRLNI